MTRSSRTLSYEDSRSARSSRGGSAMPSAQRSSRGGRRASVSSSRQEFDLASSRSSRANHPSWYSAEDQQRAAQQRRSSRPSVESYSADSRRGEGGSFGPSSDRGRKRAKERASRKFDRQFGGASDASAPQAGPRAAVYRAEMGSSHRRSSRMQGNPGQEAAADSPRPKQKKRASVSRRPLMLGMAAVLVCLFAAGVFLYPTAQTYYQSVRERDRLQAEYTAVVERNQQLQDRVTSLSTDEGVAAYVHDRYGWVSPGENAVVIRGLTDQTGNALDDLSVNVTPGSVEAPQTWYSPVLDVLFGLKR